MSQELYKKYRPKTLDEVIGQDQAVKILKGFIEKKKLPQTILLSGDDSSGCGKTTIARCLVRPMGCNTKLNEEEGNHSGDFFEQDGASNGGIDDIRAIKNRVGLSALYGKSKVFLIDECFPSGTKITTDEGYVPIEQIHVGDMVHNVAGKGRVTNTFVNQVELDRVIRLHFSDGSSLVTTKQHEFLTTDGWIEAYKLSFEHCILASSCYIVSTRENQYESMFHLSTDVFFEKENTKNLLKKLCVPTKSKRLRKEFYSRKKKNKKTSCLDMCELQRAVSTEKNPCGMLFKKMCSKTKSTKKRPGTIGAENMSCLRSEFYGQMQEQKSLLQHVLCEKELHSQQLSGACGFTEQRQSQTKSKDRLEKSASFGKGRYLSEETIRENDEMQSCSQTGGSGKNKTNTNKKWHFQNMERGTWRKRQNNNTPGESLQRAMGSYALVNVAEGSVNSNTQEKSLSYQLQSGYRKQESKNSCRGRWEKPSIEKRYLERCEKDDTTRIIRVESIEVYQQGCNESSFVGIIGDTERNQGWVTFYDIEVNDHPSYFAEGLPVHNCHRISEPAQQAMLKVLEDTPPNNYFMLATTNAGKLLKTIKTRCTEIKVSPLAPKHMKLVIERVLKGEKAEITEDVMDKLIEAAEGSARKALVTLEQILQLDSEDDQIDAIRKTESKRQAIEIARGLINGTSWRDMATILKEVTEEPESLRYMILGYARTILLKGGKLEAKARDLIRAFEFNFFDSKHAGLAVACWDFINKK